jgi:phenylalanyl-tRNA synthetase beta subunit
LIHSNVKSKEGDMVLYELGLAHVKGLNSQEGLPSEFSRLSLVSCVSQSSKDGASYYQIKYYVDYLLSSLGIENISYRPLNEAKLSKEWDAATQAFEPIRSAVVYSGNKLVGLVGEPTLGLRTSLKLGQNVAQAELSVEALQELSSTDNLYQPLNKFPSLEQDICLRVDHSVSYELLVEVVKKAAQSPSDSHGYMCYLSPVDIYHRENDKNKQITIHIVMMHPDRTLTTDEANSLLDHISGVAKQELNAERV